MVQFSLPGQCQGPRYWDLENSKHWRDFFCDCGFDDPENYIESDQSSEENDVTINVDQKADKNCVQIMLTNARSCTSAFSKILENRILLQLQSELQPDLTQYVRSRTPPGGPLGQGHGGSR